jgi:hypothetical protein
MIFPNATVDVTFSNKLVETAFQFSSGQFSKACLTNEMLKEDKLFSKKRRSFS